jgi:hypothetical protein
MNSQLRQITIRFGSSAVESSELPGNPKMWAVIEPKIGKLKCRRSFALLIKSFGPWPEHWTEALFRSHLTFKGLQEIHFEDQLKQVSLQVFRRGREPDALALVLADLLSLDTGPAERPEIFALRQFQFQSDRDGLPPEELKAALEHLLSLGSPSGIFHPSIESARVLVPGPIEPVRDQTDLTAVRKQADKIMVKSIERGAWSSLRRTFKRSEFCNHSKTASAEDRLRPLESLANYEQNKILPKEGVEAPLSMLVSHPKNPDQYGSFERFRYRCENTAALYDRSLGAVIFRESSPGAQIFDVWSPLPLNNRMLETAPPSPMSHLCCVGPWDSRNPLAERRIELWIQQASKQFVIEGEVIDGDQDWVSYAADVLRRSTGGWSAELDHIALFLRDNVDRSRCGRAWLFWSPNEPDLIAESAAEFNVPFTILARREPMGTGWALKKDDQSVLSVLSLESLQQNSNLNQMLEVKWDYPDLKAPTYGFERVAVYPDEYMMKVTQRSAQQQAWAMQLARCFSGDRLRSVLLRNPACSPIPGFRWTDGDRVWAEAFGHQPGWMDVDPRRAGQAAVDLALRTLVALGANPGHGQAMIWLSQPDLSALNAQGPEWAAYLLALEGSVQMIRAYGYSLRSISGGALSFQGVRDEVFVGLKNKLHPKAPTTLPGFRMSGENLYCVGPKPVFMDAGTKLLDFVPRIMSNHISELDPKAQLDLYTLIAKLLGQGMVTSVRPVGWGGVAETIAEMALWSGMGAQLRPTLTTMELFSGAPGRLIVGVLPQDAKVFESQIRSEDLVVLGTSGGERVCGMPVTKVKESRLAK